MKKILIVMRSMHNSGGVETALVNMIDEIYGLYDIDLFSFTLSNSFRQELSGKVNIIESNFLIEMLGKEQSKYKKTDINYYLRALLVIFCRIFGNTIPLKLILKTKKMEKKYDIALSYIQAATKHSLSCGNNQFVLSHVSSNQRFVVIHSDYEHENFNNSYHNELYAQFDKILTVSNSCKNKIIECVPQFVNKVYVLHNFYSISKIKEKSCLFVPNYCTKKLNFVTVARLSDEKGIIRMIDVIAKMDNVETFIWNIIGGGDLYETIRQKIIQYRLDKIIKLYGNQLNPYPYILNADLMIVCSKYEAAPMVIGEAQILNIPVLSTRTLSAEEQISDNITGFICENSEVGLYNSLSKILNDRSILQLITMNLVKNPVSNKLQLQELNDITQSEG